MGGNVNGQTADVIPSDLDLADMDAGEGVDPEVHRVVVERARRT